MTVAIARNGAIGEALWGKPILLPKTRLAVLRASAHYILLRRCTIPSLFCLPLCAKI
jgi:hypothetical protein